MNKIKILIVDDHNFIVEGIVAMLKNNKDIEVIGTANSGKEAILKFESLNPDIIIMDISMPDISGIEATKIIINKQPLAKIIALTQHEDSEYISQFFKAGGVGYLLKTAKKNEFLEAIDKVNNGIKYISNSASTIIVESLISPTKDENTKEIKIPLTSRELEIIKLIATDLNNIEIADKLNISIRTVETHRRNIMQKLNVKSVVALIRYAIQNNIITIN